MNQKKLYKHQERFIAKNPDRALLVWEMQTGKTRAACEWLKLRPKHKALIICPKLIVEKWKRELKEWGSRATVVSMSMLPKVNINIYGGGAVILDEAQHFASPLFNAGRSKRTEVIYNFLRQYPSTHVLLLSATPVRSTPWNIHTLGAFVGQFYPVKLFRDRFFYFTDIFGRWHWEKKSDWRKQVRPYVERISDIVLMSDCVDIPLQHEEVVEIHWNATDEKLLSNEYAEPAKEWSRRHKAENGRRKFDVLEPLLDGYRKVIVVCHYTEQINNYVEWIGDTRQVYVLNGQTKDQDATIEAAKAADDCVFIIQASMGAGFSASEFSVIIFASMSFRYVDLVQMRGRIKVITNLHENNFIYLIGGKCDQRVYETIMAGKDFDVLQEI